MSAEQDGDALTENLCARFARAPATINHDAWLVHRGRFLSLEVLVEIGSVPHYLTIERGRIAALASGPQPLREWTFAVRGASDAWDRLWRPVPAPQEQDLFAFAKRGEMRFEGKLQVFLANLFYFKEVLTAPRRDGSAP
jgi:hypothetical protein